MRKYWPLLVLTCLILSYSCQGQKKYTTHISKQDSKVFDRFKEYSKSEPGIKEVLLFFIDTPYLGGTLNIKDKEELVINLSGLDCSTFIESAISLYACYKSEDLSLKSFANKLQSIRYRDGNIEDYTSRIHYSSDWIYENVKNNVVEDITKDFGGISFNPNINFMSTHSKKYKALKDGKYVERIKEIEDAVNKREYYYIPKRAVPSIEDKLRDGDIIFITTDIKGLDISHVGFAIRKEGKTHLLHASSTGKRIMISKRTLGNYLANIKHDTGIIICRLK
jgi:hypothetical protein